MATVASKAPRPMTFRRSSGSTSDATAGARAGRHAHLVTDRVRSMVSREKRRLKTHGYDLDLSYITRRLVAMGYPATDLEGMYRNNLVDVVAFFEEHHQDHYRLYNLCEERSYDPEPFHGRVGCYPFKDHNPPALQLFLPFCKDVSAWIRSDEDNVAAVHCKAGKGRTGTMICAYMLFSGEFRDAEESMHFFGFARTNNQKGVTIPSQRRFITYFAQLLRLWDEQERVRRADSRAQEVRERDGRRMTHQANSSSRIESLEEMERIRRHLLSGEEDDSDTDDDEARQSMRQTTVEHMAKDRAFEARAKLAQQAIISLESLNTRYDADVSGFLEKQEHVTAIFDACRAERQAKAEAENKSDTLRPIMNPRGMPSRVQNLVHVFEALATTETQEDEDDEEDDDGAMPLADIVVEGKQAEEDVARQLQEARRAVRRRSQILPVTPTPQRTPRTPRTPSSNLGPTFEELAEDHLSGLGGAEAVPLFTERGAPGPPIALAITQVVLHGLPKTLMGTYEPLFTITCGEIVYKSQDILPPRKYPQARRTVLNVPNLAVVEEVLVVFYQKPMIGAAEKLFQCWFHTFFIKDKQLLLPKAELDKACRDKHHKRFPKEFALELRFDDLTDEERQDARAKRSSWAPSV